MMIYSSDGAGGLIQVAQQVEIDVLANFECRELA